jgi:hypothetical protein
MTNKEFKDRIRGHLEWLDSWLYFCVLLMWISGVLGAVLLFFNKQGGYYFSFLSVIASLVVFLLWGLSIRLVNDYLDLINEMRAEAQRIYEIAFQEATERGYADPRIHALQAQRDYEKANDLPLEPARKLEIRFRK